MADEDDDLLLRTAEIRSALDDGKRYSLDEVMAETGISRRRLPFEIALQLVRERYADAIRLLGRM